jgi:hypothetical protein
MVPSRSTAFAGPVYVYGNLIAATRGETVPNEVLGSGEPTGVSIVQIEKEPADLA